MKPVPILSASAGVNVVDSETKLASNEVRLAQNVIIPKTGGMQIRDGYARSATLTRPHSFWSAKERRLTLFVVGGQLCRVDSAQPFGYTVLASGLWDDPARYAERGGAVYVSAGRMLRVDPDDSVRPTGVASVIGSRPSLAATADGGLEPGRYGVAFSVVNDLGQESGLSDAAWIDLAGGGIATTVPYANCNLYRTSCNGSEFYLAARGGSQTLTFGELGRREQGWLMDTLPYGGDIAHHNSRLYSAQGTTLYVTEPYSELVHAARGFIPFGSRCDRMLLPLAGGLFVGTDEGAVWLTGTGPADFRRLLASEGAPVRHSGVVVDGTFFPDKLTDGAAEVAVWLSDVGFQLGLPDGRVLTPQASRVLLSGVARAVTTPVIQKGVKQLLCALESMVMGQGGAADTTL